MCFRKYTDLIFRGPAMTEEEELLESRTTETKEEFIKRYNAQSDIDLFEDLLVALQCKCERYGGWWHWCAVIRERGAIERHMSLNGP